MRKERHCAAKNLLGGRVQTLAPTQVGEESFHNFHQLPGLGRSSGSIGVENATFRLKLAQDPYTI